MDPPVDAQATKSITTVHGFRLERTAGAVEPLIEMLKSGGGPAEQGAGCLMNLASNNSENQLAIQKKSALQPLLAMAPGGATGFSDLESALSQADALLSSVRR